MTSKTFPEFHANCKMHKQMRVRTLYSKECSNFYKPQNFTRNPFFGNTLYENEICVYSVQKIKQTRLGKINNQGQPNLIS